MRVLSILHTLFICNVRPVAPGRVGYQVSRARVQLLLPLFAICAMGLLNPWITTTKHLSNCTNWYTIVGRVLSSLAIVILLIVDNFRQRHRLLGLLQALPTAVAFWNGKAFTVKNGQLLVLVLCNVLALVEMVVHIYQRREYTYIAGVLTGSVVGHYILLNVLLCQILAETIANGYEALQRSLPGQPPHTFVAGRLLALEHCKRQLADVFGFKLLTLLVHLLVNVSFCTYDILQKLLSQEHLNDIARLAIIASEETTMLFGLCFYHSLLDLKFLNLYNHFFVTPVYLERDSKANDYVFRIRNLYWNAVFMVTVTLLSTGSSLMLLLADSTQLFASVMGIVTLILYGVRLLVTVPLIIWTLASSRDLVAVSNSALAIERQLNPTFLRKTRCIWKLAQLQFTIAIAVFLVNVAFLSFYVWMFPDIRRLQYITLMLGFATLELTVSTHRGYTQFWANFMGHKYGQVAELVRHRDQTSLRTAIGLSDVLEGFKRRMTLVFGVMQLLHVLHVFVTCSVEAYIVFYIIDIGADVMGVSLNLFIVVLYGISFLIYTYDYNLAHVKLSARIGRGCRARALDYRIALLQAHQILTFQQSAQHSPSVFFSQLHQSGSMDELKFFNVFNYGYVTPTYLFYDTRAGRYAFRVRNLYWNVTLLSVAAVICAVSSLELIREVLRHRITSVMGITTIAVFGMRLLVVLPLIIWTLVCKGRLMENCAGALNIVDSSFPNQTLWRRQTFVILWIQICTIVVTLLFGLAMQCYSMWLVYRIRNIHYLLNLCAYCVLEYVTFMHLMHTQCWAMYISHLYGALIGRIEARDHSFVSLQTVMTSCDDLESFRRRIASSFQLMNVLHVLDVLVTCAIETYTIFYVLEMGYGFSVTMLNFTTLALFTMSFFAYTYAHSAVLVKFLNLFNYLFISSIYLYIDSQTNRYAFRNRNLYWNATILTVSAVSCAVAISLLIVRDISTMMRSVIGVISLILHLVHVFVLAVLIVWTLVQSRNLLETSNSALAIAADIRDSWDPPADKRDTFLLLKGELCAIILFFVVIVTMNSHMLWANLHLVELRSVIFIYGTAVTEFVIYAHRVYIQFWGTFLLHQYGDLLLQVQAGQYGTFLPIITLCDRLEGFKRQIATSCGPMQLLHILHIFITCSSEAYMLFYLLNDGYGVRDTLVNLFAIALSGGSCFCLTFDLEAAGRKAMSHQQILNTFNHLCVSVVYIEQTPKGAIVRRKDVLRNMLTLGVVVSIMCIMGFSRTAQDFLQMVGTITEVVHLLKYCINGQIMGSVLNWLARYNGRVVLICNEAIAIDGSIRRLRFVREIVEPRHVLLKTLIASVVFFRFKFIMINLYLQFRYHLTYDTYVILHCNVLIEMAMDLEKLFLLYFALYMAQRYEVLRQLLPRSSSATLKAVYAIYEDLIAFKKHLSETVGILLLVLILQTFMACSIHAYLIVDENMRVFQIMVNVGQLLINLSLFYILTYFYDFVEIKEAELKNALKSMQYTNLKVQTRDQKDFYDLVNLKLMTESPKITACGLFEINLQ
uniref:Gustatory receptor n=1 Tax=Anopheles dirus TaxID=7168 RepID=A0A182NJU6_9DIPT